jgi:Na+/H+-dicarboxylate symporter
MKYELPSAPLSVGGVIDSAIRLYRDSFRRCVVVALIYSAVIAAFSIAWGLSLTQAVMPGAGAANPQRMLALFFSPVVIGGFVVTSLCSLVFNGALMKM